MSKKIFLSSFIISLFITSCDVIDEPICPPLGVEYREDLYGPPPEFDPQANVLTHVLLEDFTGQQCGFCPDANVHSQELDTLFGERLSVVAIHAGGLANTGPDYPNDYTTAEGDFYFSQLDFQVTPIGRINRLPSVSDFYLMNQWQAEIENALALSCPLDLQMEAEYIAEDNVMNVHVYSRFTEAQTGTFRLVVLVIESGIVDHQLWYGHQPSEHVYDFVHQHMLRGTVTGANGENIATNPVENSSLITSYTMNWNAGWIAENCGLIAFVFNEATGQIVTCVDVELGE